MKSVLYVGCDIPDGNAAAIRVYSNALALKEYGYKVFILSFDHDRTDVMPYTSIIDGCTVFHYRYPLSDYEYLRYLISINQYIDVIKSINSTDHLDAVITYDEPAISFIRLKHYCKLNSIKLICDCAEWHTAIHLKSLAKAIKLIDINLSMRYAYKKADGVIAISKYLFEYFSSHGMREKVIRIPPLQSTKKSRNTFSANLHPKFIYAGVAGRDKDCLDAILRAFACIQDFQFEIEIFGLTEQQCIEVWPETEDYLNRIRYQSHIYFYGRREHDVVLDHTIEADYCLIVRESTRKNNAGFPTKFSESVECGTPIIATAFSDVKEYIEKYKIGIIVGSIDSLDTSLRRVMEMPKGQLIQMKKNCYYCNSFNYSNYANRIGKFLETICSK